jgi:hypothetical protein
MTDDASMPAPDAPRRGTPARRRGDVLPVERRPRLIRENRQAVPQAAGRP